MKIKSSNQFSNIYSKTSRGRKKTLMPFVRNTVDMPHNKKNWSVIYGLLVKIGEFSLMEGNSTSTTYCKIFKEIYKAIFASRKMVKKVETLLQNFFPIGYDRQKIMNFLEKAKDQYEQVKNFFSCNPRMINDVKR